MKNYKNWSADNLERLQYLNSFPEMRKIAFQVLGELPQPVIQVCGPLTTGGLGSFEANIERLGKGIEILAQQGKIIFDQRPFEDPMHKLITEAHDIGYPYEVLEEFYKPLFESGYIKELHFLPDWQSSTGSRWEHKQAERLGIAIHYFSGKF